jgi:hypothetical protein
MGSHFPNIAVFEFDRTLASMLHARGSPERISKMLKTLHEAGSEVYMVSQNSADVCRRALGPPPGINVLGLASPYILGREDYDGSTPKRAVTTLPSTCTRASATQSGGLRGECNVDGPAPADSPFRSARLLQL